MPALAATGKITVMTGAGTATSGSDFTVTLKPVVTNFFPKLGVPGTAVNIEGINFTNITSVAFGGENLDEIYVTSMARVKHPAVHGRFTREAKPQFLAGSLFRITGLGIRGVPEPRFAG